VREPLSALSALECPLSPWVPSLTKQNLNRTQNHEVIALKNIKKNIFKDVTRGDPWAPRHTKQNLNRTQNHKYLQREDWTGGLVRTQYVYICTFVHVCVYVHVRMYNTCYVLTKPHIPSSPLCLLGVFTSCLNFTSWARMPNLAAVFASCFYVLIKFCFMSEDARGPPPYVHVCVFICVCTYT